MRPALLASTERIGYIEAWDEQRRLAGLVRAGDSPAILWLLEHDPVYTYGRHGTRDDLFITDDALAALGATCLASDRGGHMTWHGPGQLVGYPIVRLPEPVDVVVLDIEMPGMNGIELLKTIRFTNPSIPFIIFYSS